MDLGSGEMGMVAAEMAVDSGMTTAGMGMTAVAFGMAAADSGVLAADSGILPAGAILGGVMGDGMGMEARAEAIVRVATAQIIAAAGCNCL